MGTYNGGRFLAEQLRSIEEQSAQNWILTVSDDGSADDTLAVCRSFQEKWGEGKLRLASGPQKGFCRNFLSMTLADSTGADYFAWADQDDVWLPFKLRRILDLILPYGESVPVLYCGRTRLIDENGGDRGFSPLRALPPPGFSNAVVQSLAGANTMAFNRAARELITQGEPYDLVSHDWWAYQIVSGAGGVVVYDSTPSVKYRQHGANAIGTNFGLIPFLSRVRRAWRQNFRKMNDRNLSALFSLEKSLTALNREVLEAVAGMRRRLGIFSIHRNIRKYHIYRRSLIQQIALYIGFMAQKV
jgi:glycosyltransferase involved in cell wall biosynthesis